MHVSELLASARSEVLPNSLWLKTLAVFAYAAASYCIMQHSTGRMRKILFAVVNVGIIAGYEFANDLNKDSLHVNSFVSVSLYVLAVSSLYLLTRFLAFKKNWWIAATMPIFLLATSRYGPSMISGLMDNWIGLSYMAFRLSQLVVIVRNKVTPMPDIFEYLGFAFFAPTVFVGPISSYSTFQATFNQMDRTRTPFGECALRMLVGGSKILFLSSMLARLSYVGLLGDGHMHAPIDLVVATICYYLYLYCNFSGICDVAIGTAGLFGIKVSENFNQPFKARNIKDFWNRWHMTLSGFMRDMVFSPMTKALISQFPKMASHCVAFSIFVIFLLIGIWHGRQLNYICFGLIHAVGVVTNFYYDLALKKYLTRTQLKAYNENRYIKMIAVVITFSYVSLSFFVFANSPNQMQEILHATKW
jgi:D-alanyl-lipoteichoic acid acyltransferase DltB (MBOAT superfamily)